MSDPASFEERHQRALQRALQEHGDARIDAVGMSFCDPGTNPSRKRMRSGVITVRNREGRTGHCRMPLWGWQGVDWPFAMRRVAERLTGRQAFAFERNWSDMRACGIDRLVTTVVDVALWDLLGRTRREAVCEILGRRRTGIKAYWSTPFNHGPPEEYARCAVQCREDGYGGYKIHPCRDPDEETCRRDMDIYAEVRTAVGPHYPLMCDNFYSYDYDTALIVGRQLRNLHYAWYESPFEESPATLPDHIRLHRELKGLKLCGPERWRHSHEERLEWIRSEACDIGRTDVFYGGFTPLLQVVSTCEQAGKPCELHIGLRPHFQVFGATDETLIEYVEDYGDGFEIDKDGLVDIPMEPGFGFDVESRSAGEVVRKLNGTTKQPAERN